MKWLPTSRGLHLCLGIGVASFVTIQFIMLMFIPLMPAQSDSSWYYNNVHYVLTGTYVFESYYPSFTEPSQYYPFLGYSFLLYVCHYISQIMNCSWGLTVKLVQFGMYLTSGFLIFKIADSYLSKRYFAYMLLLLYVSYYPYFNFTYLVMSETLGVFLLVSSIYFFMKYLSEARKNEDKCITADQVCRSSSIRYLGKNVNIILFMLIAGWAILVRPVYALLYLFLITFFALLTIKRRQYTKLFTVLLFFALPLCQSLFSKYHYGNYQLKTGVGWNLWNRVIQLDGLVPSNSKSLEQMLLLAQVPDRKLILNNYWWDVTAKLSSLGFKERFIQDLCLQVAVDGIKEHPATYIKNTLAYSFEYYKAGMENRVWKTDLDDYYRNIHNLSSEKHNKPLTDALLAEAPKKISSFSKRMVEINKHLASLQRINNFIMHNTLVSMIFLMVPIAIVITIVIKKQFLNYTPHIVLWLTGFLVLFGSTLSETAVDRYLLPVVMFVVLSVVLTIETLMKLLNRNN